MMSISPSQDPSSSLDEKKALCVKLNALATLLDRPKEKLKLFKDWVIELEKKGLRINRSMLSNYVKANENKAGHTYTKKSIYEEIIKLIEQYLHEESILKNQGYKYYEGKDKQEYIQNHIHNEVSLQENITTKQTEEIKEKLFDEEHDRFWGIYEGYFIRPSGVKGKPTKRGNFSKLTVVLYKNVTRNKIEVCVRTTHAEKHKTHPYYTGHCTLTEKNLTIDIGMPNGDGNYGFLLVFSIKDKKLPNEYDGWLEGIYGGLDPLMESPSSGRMILRQSETWSQIGIKPYDQVFSEYLAENAYKPIELTDSKVMALMQIEVFKDFFTIDGRYTEQIDIVDRYDLEGRDYASLIKIRGNYSIFFLNSNGKQLNWGICSISSLGEISVNGSRDSKTGLFKQYDGMVNLLENDNAYISLSGRDNESDVVGYLIKISTTDKGEGNKYYNGVRIRTSHVGDHKPIATRVVLVEEPPDFYSKNKSLEPIVLFPKNAKQQRSLDKFNKAYPGITVLLTGFENNIIKAFSQEREQFIRDIDYGNCFLLTAKALAQEDKPDLSKVVLYLHFAQMHGLSQSTLLNDKAFARLKKEIMEHVELYKPTNKSNELFRIKTSSVDTIKRKVRAGK